MSGQRPSGLRLLQQQPALSGCLSFCPLPVGNVLATRHARRHGCPAQRLAAAASRRQRRGSIRSEDSPAAHPTDATSTTDTVANVLLLLGGSSTSSCAVSCDGATTEDNLCDAGTLSAMHSAALSSAGCPPNAPARRRPPVMLLPAEELPGLLLAA
uniref:Uncharacterized protein n=1 Tax=Tetradesmus obliquus TaxID=3088 RepID=A0A383W324_TETOB|eukprot:jgi/Sobl393_1/1104/SZX72058.1